MSLRDNMRSWLGLTDDQAAQMRGNCEYTGQHHFEARFDEKPTFCPTPDDIIKFQGSQTKSRKLAPGRGGTDEWMAQVDYIPYVGLDAQLQLVNASKEKVYLGDSCKYCGKFVRYTRDGG